MKMKTTNPLFAKIRLFLIVLTLCVIVTCIFLVIIHPEAWIAPVCVMAVALCILLYQVFGTRKKQEVQIKCCFFNSSATASSSLYHSSPNLRIKGSFRNLQTGTFSFFLTEPQPCIHPNDDNSPLYKVRNLQCEQDKDDMISVYRNLFFLPGKLFQQHSSNILSRHNK